MRRLKYNPFDKPVNFGEWDPQQHYFVLDKEIKEGLYLFTIEDNDDNDLYSVVIKVKGDRYCAGVIANGLNDEYSRVILDLDEPKYIYVESTGSTGVSDNSLIYIYKIA